MGYIAAIRAGKKVREDAHHHLLWSCIKKHQQANSHKWSRIITKHSQQAVSTSYMHPAHKEIWIFSYNFCGKATLYSCFFHHKKRRFFCNTVVLGEVFWYSYLNIIKSTIRFLIILIFFVKRYESILHVPNHNPFHMAFRPLICFKPLLTRSNKRTGKSQESWI